MMHPELWRSLYLAILVVELFFKDVEGRTRFTKDNHAPNPPALTFPPTCMGELPPSNTDLSLYDSLQDFCAPITPIEGLQNMGCECVNWPDRSLPRSKIQCQSTPDEPPVSLKPGQRRRSRTQEEQYCEAHCSCEEYQTVQWTEETDPNPENWLGLESDDATEDATEAFEAAKALLRNKLRQEVERLPEIASIWDLYEKHDLAVRGKCYDFGHLKEGQFRCVRPPHLGFQSGGKLFPRRDLEFKDSKHQTKFEYGDPLDTTKGTAQAEPAAFETQEPFDYELPEERLARIHQRESEQLKNMMMMMVNIPKKNGPARCEDHSDCEPGLICSYFDPLNVLQLGICTPLGDLFNLHKSYKELTAHLPRIWATSQNTALKIQDSGDKKSHEECRFSAITSRSIKKHLQCKHKLECAAGETCAFDSSVFNQRGDPVEKSAMSRETGTCIKLSPDHTQEVAPTQERVRPYTRQDAIDYDAVSDGKCWDSFDCSSGFSCQPLSILFPERFGASTMTYCIADRIAFRRRQQRQRRSLDATLTSTETQTHGTRGEAGGLRGSASL
ncbi:MAG: hypothetical protein M1824_005243 [Vezdaea acicularis]|nr:MAG: hypothetical protein M1824_005243 [Vezdaea acicularis]